MKKKKRITVQDLMEELAEKNSDFFVNLYRR